MKKATRVENFEKYKKGMFVHFGLYSILGRGEWVMHDERIPPKEYESLALKFKVKKNWTEKLIQTAKSFGAKYIVLTTRHHDGFSLYDTKGLSKYDIMHTPTKRDLIKEFVEACNKNDIAPFFYCTLIDWHDERFSNNFEEYFSYLLESVKLLCTKYGKIGGFWFDGTWFSEKKIDWNIDEIFNLIRKYQKSAIISNNGGLKNRGEVINKEIDCTIFERNSSLYETSFDKKYRAKELCETINDHWGYSKKDKNFKSVSELVAIYETCQRNNANLLLNVGPKKNGKVGKKERKLLKIFGKKTK